MTSSPISIGIPRENSEYRTAWLLWLCCALSLEFIIFIPTIPAAIFMCALLLYCALYPLCPYRALSWNVIPWVIVAFGALSVLWSEQPMQSLRAAPQIAISVLAAIMFAQALRASSFIAIILYASIAANAVNFFVAVMLTSFWVMLDKQQPKLARIIALLAFLAAPLMLVSADSQGALLAGSLALAASMVPFLLRRLDLTTRTFLIFSGGFLIVAALGVALLAFDNLPAALLDSIGKDVSLTGRTLLWANAVSIIADHPFGLGLQAFWVESNDQAVRFWETFYINNHYGFHFHDLWLETGVELGVIGILIAAVTTLVVFASVWRWVLRDPQPASCYFLGFVIFIVARTLGEVELYGQFSLTSVIFMASYYYADSANRSSSR